MSTIEDDIVPMQRDVKYNSHLAAQHAAHLDDLENRLFLNNVHALGIPERNSVTFIEQWPLAVFGKDTFLHIFTAGWAHRVPAHPLPPGNHPCPFLFKLLNCKDRDAILFKAKTMGGALVIDNSKVSFFPDFSAEL